MSSPSKVASVDSSSHEHDDGDLSSQLLRDLNMEEFGFMGSPVASVSSSSCSLLRKVYDTLETKLRQKFEVSSIEASSHKDDDGDHSKVFRNLDLEEFGFISSPVSNNIVAPVSSPSCSSLRKEYHDTLESELRQKLEVSSVESSSHKDGDGDHSKSFRNLKLEECGFISSPVSNNIVAPVSSSSCSSLRKEYHDTLETELRQKFEVSSIEASSHKDDDGDHSKVFRNLDLEEFGFISSPVSNNIVAPVSSSSCSSLRKEDDSPETEFRRMLSKLPTISTSSSESERPSSYLSCVVMDGGYMVVECGNMMDGRR
ncbi:hypothetical protein U1Q18_008787 [Sarracenia purpurea var. burkii]